MKNESNWLALAIGNSRLHWAWFKHDTSIETWNTRHLSITVEEHSLPQQFLSRNLIEQNFTRIPVYLASVVPRQTELWRNYSQLNLISIKDVELTNTYPTMGIDRALAAWGAISTYHQPCLVIDGGTALTLTAVNEQRQLLGGAILPGLRAQFTTLKQKTAGLPEIKIPNTLPPRWALDTERAIASGVVYTTIAGIHSYIVDWLRQFPLSKVIFTGGDGELLSQYLHSCFPEAQQTVIDRNLVFWGILVYKQQRTSK